jgi:hypothetical protein
MAASRQPLLDPRLLMTNMVADRRRSSGRQAAGLRVLARRWLCYFSRGPPARAASRGLSVARPGRPDPPTCRNRPSEQTESTSRASKETASRRRFVRIRVASVECVELPCLCRPSSRSCPPLGSQDSVLAAAGGAVHELTGRFSLSSSHRPHREVRVEALSSLATLALVSMQPWSASRATKSSRGSRSHRCRHLPAGGRTHDRPTDPLTLSAAGTQPSDREFELCS